MGQRTLVPDAGSEESLNLPRRVALSSGGSGAPGGDWPSASLPPVHVAVHSSGLPGFSWSPLLGSNAEGLIVQPSRMTSIQIFHPMTLLNQCLQNSTGKKPSGNESITWGWNGEQVWEQSSIRQTRRGQRFLSAPLSTHHPRMLHSWKAPLIFGGPHPYAAYKTSVLHQAGELSSESSKS